MGDKFAEGILFAKFWPPILEKITQIIRNDSRFANFHSIFCEACRYGDLAARLLITPLRIIHLCFKLDL